MTMTRRPATIEQVAEAAGVSRSTVSRVVNGSSAVSPETLDAVRTAIADLGYVPNRAARSLASSQTYAIALVVPEDTSRFFGDPFFADVVAGINACLAPTDYVLNLLIASNDAADKTTTYLRSGNVDGAIVVSHHAGDAFLDAIVDAVPTVFGGRPSRGHDATARYVDVDNVTGGRVATEHLLARGCRAIATITGPRDMAPAVDRLEGCRVALAAVGSDPVAIVDGDFSVTGGVAAMAEILDAGITPDGVFAASDLMARGAMSVLAARGIRVPEDIAVIGFDDAAVARDTAPQLTTIRQPARLQGEVMAQMLLDLLAGDGGERVRIVDTELIVRDTA